MQRRGHRDRIAIEAKIEGGDDRHLDVAKPQARRDRDRRQQVRGVEQADVELVADVRPRHFPHQRDIEPFRRGKALVDSNDQGGGIDQRNEAYAKRSSHFSNSDAVRIDCAISPIFFFSRIAVDRSSTYASSSVRPFSFIRIPLARSISLRSSSADLARSSSSCSFAKALKREMQRSRIGLMRSFFNPSTI